MKYLKQITYVLVLIGGLNWGFYGLYGRDLIDIVLGSIPMVARITYVLVGLSALYSVLNYFSSSCSCKNLPTCNCIGDECCKKELQETSISKDLK